MNNQYDSYTAITFLMIGLGAGALLTLLLGPEQGIRHRIREYRMQNSEQTRGQRMSA